MKTANPVIVVLFAAMAAAIAIAPARTMAAEETAAEAKEAPAIANPVATHMPEDVRGSIAKVVILPTEGKAGQAVTGTYAESTQGIAGGMADGSKIGVIPVEVGGIPIGIPIPILREIGMITGALIGGAKNEIQEFRDALVDDLKDATEGKRAGHQVPTT